MTLLDRAISKLENIRNEYSKSYMLQDVEDALIDLYTLRNEMRAHNKDKFRMSELVEQGRWKL